MTAPLFAAVALGDQIERAGAYFGYAAIVGLGVLSLLYFAQAREVKRLREWAGRAPERDAELAQRVQTDAQRRVAQPIAAPAPAVVPATPGTAAAQQQADAARKAAAAAVVAKFGQPVVATPPAASPGVGPPGTLARTTPPGAPAAVPAPASPGASQPPPGGAPPGVVAPAAAFPAADGSPAAAADSAAGGASPAPGAATPGNPPASGAAAGSDAASPAAGASGAGAGAQAAGAAAAAKGAAGSGSGTPAPSAPPGPASPGAVPSASPGPASPGAVPPGMSPATAGAVAAARQAVTPSRTTGPAYANGAGQETHESDAARPASYPDLPPRPPRSVASAPAGEGGSRRRVGVIVAGVGAAVAIAVVLVVLLSSGSDPPAPAGNEIGDVTPPAAVTPPPAPAATAGKVDRAATQVAVLNGTTTTGLARGVADKLQKSGFTILKVGDNTDQAIATTTISYASGGERAARAVAQIVDVSSAAVKPLDANTSVVAPEAKVVVVVGNDRSTTG